MVTQTQLSTRILIICVVVGLLLIPLIFIVMGRPVPPQIVLAMGITGIGYSALLILTRRYPLFKKIFGMALGLLLGGLIIYGIISILRLGSQTEISVSLLVSVLPVVLLAALLLYFYFWSAILVRFGRVDLAIAHYSNLIRLRPKSYLNYSNRGALQFRLKDASAALDDYNTAVELSHQHPVLLIERANLHLVLGDYPAAFIDLDEAAVRLHAYEEPKPAAGTGVTEGIQIKNPEILHELIHYYRGVAHYFLGNLEAARTELQREPAPTPETAAVSTNLGVLRNILLAMVEAKEQNNEAAVLHWQTAQQTSPIPLDSSGLRMWFGEHPQLLDEIEQVLQPIIVNETTL